MQSSRASMDLSTTDTGTPLSLSQLSLDYICQDTVPLSRSLSLISQPILICDAGYGFPREARPRKEKILAIARQLVNFLQWQEQSVYHASPMAKVRVVSCPDDEIRQALQDRTLSLLGGTELPSHVSFSCEGLEDTCPNTTMGSSDQVIYLSPDANESLDPSHKPPRVVVVGLLIDRRIQPNRSNDRAFQLDLVSKRWPLESFFQEISANEPLNVDCVLEGMQQWWWNTDNLLSDNPKQEHDGKAHKEAFVQAASQAINHHAERHPSRPVHLTS